MPTPSAHQLNRLDQRIAAQMQSLAVPLLRLSLAIIFIWFGGLKLFNVSPANELVTRTVYWFDPRWFIPFLGAWEVLIGLLMLYRPTIRASILLLALQMPGTFLPLILLPDICFSRIPLVPSLEGQYIIKNLVLIAAAIAIGGTVRQAHPVAQA